MDRVVETTGKTVDQAVEIALNELGIEITDAVIEILDRGDKGGLFGFGRQPARVRVTAIDEDDVDHDDEDEDWSSDEEEDHEEQAEREHEDDWRRDQQRTRGHREDTASHGHRGGKGRSRGRRGDDHPVPLREEEDEAHVLLDYDVVEEDDAADDADEWKVPAEDRGLESAENAALDYVEAILSGIGIHGRLESYINDDGGLEIDISGNDCGVAIGRHGETLDAIQYLTNIVANRRMDSFLRVTVDVSGYRRRREQRLSRMAKETADRVLATGRESKLKPMTPAERRVIHMTLRDVEGISTYSEGTDPTRYVVIAPSVGVEFINE